MDKFGVKEVADLTFYDLETGDPVLYLDTLKMTSLENTASTTKATGGKGNATLLQWDFGRESKMSCQDALMSEESLALINGTEVKRGKQTIRKREVLVAVAGTTGETKVSAEFAPIQAVGKATVKDSVGARISGEIEKVAIKAVTTKDITFSATDVPAGSKVEVYYTAETGETSSRITIESDKFSGFYQVVGDTFIRNSRTGKDESFQLILHKVKVDAGNTLTFQADGDPSVFDMNLEVLKPDDSTVMVDMIKY